MKRCFQKQKTTCGKHIFSLVLRVVNIYILVFNISKTSKILRFILRNNGAAILVEFLLDATFSGVQFTWSFCVNDYNAKMKTRIACTNSFLPQTVFVRK